MAKSRIQVTTKLAERRGVLAAGFEFINFHGTRPAAARDLADRVARMLESGNIIEDFSETHVVFTNGDTITVQKVEVN